MGGGYHGGRYTRAGPALLDNRAGLALLDTKAGLALLDTKAGLALLYTRQAWLLCTLGRPGPAPY